MEGEIPKEENLNPEAENPIPEENSLNSLEGVPTPEKQEPEQEFDYEAEKTKIEARLQERAKKLDDVVAELFQAKYIGELGAAIRQAVKVQEAGGQLSQHQRLLFTLEIKRKEIVDESIKAREKLETEKQEHTIKKIGEI